MRSALLARFPWLAAGGTGCRRLILPFAFQAPLQSRITPYAPRVRSCAPPVAAFRDWLLAEASQQNNIENYLPNGDCRPAGENNGMAQLTPRYG